MLVRFETKKEGWKYEAMKLLALFGRYFGPTCGIILVAPVTKILLRSCSLSHVEVTRNLFDRTPPF